MYNYCYHFYYRCMITTTPRVVVYSCCSCPSSTTPPIVVVVVVVLYMLPTMNSIHALLLPLQYYLPRWHRYRTSWYSWFLFLLLKWNKMRVNSASHASVSTTTIHLWYIFLSVLPPFVMFWYFFTSHLTLISQSVLLMLLSLMMT